MRALIADGLNQAVCHRLQPRATELGIEILYAGSREEADRLLPDADLVLTKRYRLGAAEITRSPRLRGVQKLGVVTDNLDVGALKAAEIRVRTFVLPSSVSVAEHTLALMLALARGLPQGMRAMQQPAPVPSVTTSETTFAYNWAAVPTQPLRGRRLGLIGFGEIGQQVARRARAFGMRVSYAKRTPLPAHLERRFGVRLQSLDDLLRTSDVVSLHVPHTSETERLLDASRLGLMKPGALLVNTARGGVVDEPALVAALESGHLGGAGLDVFTSEPLPHTSELLRLESTLLTPHVAGAGSDALVAGLERQLALWR